MPSPTRHLTIFLFKPQITRVEECVVLRADENVRVFDLSQATGLAGKLFLRQPRSSRPWWVNFFSGHVLPELEPLFSQSVSAVLIIQILVSEQFRFFALSFGHGQHLLNQDMIECDFGLKTALNILDHNMLRAVDIKTIEEGTIHTRRQVSQVSPLRTFGLDISRDLLNGVTGKCADLNIASRVTGAQSLALDGVSLTFEALESLFLELIDAYGSDRYIADFGWIDHLADVSRQKQLCDTLDQRLIIALRAREFTRMHIAPPEMLSWDHIAGFTYDLEDPGEEVFPDLDLTHLMSLMGDSVTRVTPSDLKRKWRVTARDENRNEWGKWSVYRCFVFETEAEDNTYVLSNGFWYRVARSFSESVNDAIRGIPRCSLVFPNADPEWNEALYNSNAPRSNHDLTVMDQRLAHIHGETSRIEFCDLLGIQGQLIHIKRWSRSSTMSHLFNQGIVCAESLLRDQEFRSQVRLCIPETHRDVRNLITDARPNTSSFEIVYAVIAKTERAWPSEFPFFTKLCLKQAHERLSLLGFRVTTSKIVTQ